jgi:hypothetical protein
MNRIACVVFAVLLLALSGCMRPSVRCATNSAGRTTCVDLAMPAWGPPVAR